jgi:hypothetical protein
MSISNLEALAKEVTFDADNMWVELIDGRQIGVPLAYFPRLANAKPAQRKQFVISGGGVGIHWDSIDEDISVPALLRGQVDQTIREPKRSKKIA